MLSRDPCGGIMSQYAMAPLRHRYSATGLHPSMAMVPWEARNHGQREKPPLFLAHIWRMARRCSWQRGLHAAFTSLNMVRR